MSGRHDWFHLAMSVRPFWLVLMAGLTTGLAVFAYAPWRRKNQQNHGLIPLRDDEQD